MKPTTARFLSRPVNGNVSGDFATTRLAAGNVHRIELGNKSSKTVIMVSLLPQN